MWVEENRSSVAVTKCRFCPASTSQGTKWKEVGWCDLCGREGCPTHVHKCPWCLKRFCDICHLHYRSTDQEAPLIKKRFRDRMNWISQLHLFDKSEDFFPRIHCFDRENSGCCVIADLDQLDKNKRIVP